LYQVTVTNGPCQVSDEVNVKILPLPIAYLKEEYVYCKGKTRTISAYNSVNDYYLWSNGSDSSSVVVFEPGEIGLTTGNICGTAEARTVIVEEDCTFSIYVPSSFTPNNDGINDYWKPVVYNLSKYEVNVYNRWGEVVFHSTDPDDVWLGNAHGGAYFIQDGIYTFHLKYETDRQEAGEERGLIFMLR
jgi:gliding motility-associated-like protein